MAETVAPLESFKDCWSTFRRQALNLLTTTPSTPEEATELLKSRDALLLRLRRLRKSDEGTSMPTAIGIGVEQLQEYTSFDSLSDARSARLAELVGETEGRIAAWYAGMERKTVYQISVAERESRDRIRRLALAGAAFVGLVALMTGAVIQIFLNRSIQ